MHGCCCRSSPFTESGAGPCNHGPIRMHVDCYDVVIIGTGAGGGTIAHALQSSGANILILERGGFIPQEDENWSPAAVWEDLRYRTRERWLNRNGSIFRPYTHYCVGGNTKFWGSVLFRLRKQDFEAVEHVDGVSPEWPIDYKTLEPFYDRAERLYQVHGRHGVDPTEAVRRNFPYEAIPHSSEITEVATKLAEIGLHPFPLPLGLVDPLEREGCILCNTCNSYPCRIHAKSDAEVVCVRPAVRNSNVTLWENAYASRLLTDSRGRKVEAVEIERHGKKFRVGAALFIVSCGAVNSAALMLRSANKAFPDGLANSSGLVGKRYMAHLATMMAGFHPFRKNSTVFQKTLGINDFYLRGSNSGHPLGQIQSQGRTHAVMAKSVVPWIPMGIYEYFVARSIDWLLMSEDLPSEDNRVLIGSDGRIRLRYQPNNIAAHRQLIRVMKRILRRLGYWCSISYSHGSKNTTHQCGTLCFGTDPHDSVLDTYCRSHDVQNLFVVDASFFPSSAAINPGLTIAAQALRVADHLMENDLR